MTGGEFALNQQEIPAGRILGIDYGRRRIGLALSDPSQTLASTLKTIQRHSTSSAVDEIGAVIKEHGIVAVVVGMPYHLNGTMGRTGEEVLRFLAEMARVCQLPVVSWDERWTTVSANKALLEAGKSPSKNRQRIDQIAAAFMLQSFLDRLSYLRRNLLR